MKSFFYFMAILIAINTNQVFAAEAGMPQLDPKYWSSQIFWLVLTFAILYLVIWKIFLPKITYSVENRKSRIVNDFGNKEWKYGTEETYLKDLIEYWSNNYDWKKQEKEINKFSHYKIEIDNIPIHFIYEKGSSKNSKPLIALLKNFISALVSTSNMI